jgi:hypothetical protein
MTVKREVVVATIDHAIELAEHIRLADKEEVEALGLTVDRAVEHGVRRHAYTFLANGKVVCIGGLDLPSFFSKVASPWMLSSELMVEHWFFFAKNSRRLIRHWMEHYDRLGNYVDARYITSVRWLEWCGFTIYPAQPMPPHGVPFHYFEMVKDNGQ